MGTDRCFRAQMDRAIHSQRVYELQKTSVSNETEFTATHVQSQPLQLKGEGGELGKLKT